MTPDELEAIRERAEAATPGPWHAPHEHARTRCISMGDYGWVVGGPNWPHYDEDSEQGKADAEFIAHARTDVPALLADLDAAREERDSARATLSIVEENFRELEAERDRMRPVVEAVGVWANPDAAWAGDIRETPQDLALLAAVDTYETQEGTE